MFGTKRHEEAAHRGVGQEAGGADPVPRWTDIVRWGLTLWIARAAQEVLERRRNSSPGGTGEEFRVGRTFHPTSSQAVAGRLGGEAGSGVLNPPGAGRAGREATDERRDSSSGEECVDMTEPLPRRAWDVLKTAFKQFGKDNC